MVISPRGKQIVTMGVMRGGEKMLSPEETLYLLEQGLALVGSTPSFVPLSVFEFYRYVNIPRYLVYTELKKSGFTVLLSSSSDMFDMTAVQPAQPTKRLHIKVAVGTDAAPFEEMYNAVTELYKTADKAILAVVSVGEMNFLEMRPFFTESTN